MHHVRSGEKKHAACVGWLSSVAAASLLSLAVLPVRAADFTNVRFAEKPDHVILYIIDGLSYKTWAKTRLPVLEGLIRNGVLVEKSYLPPSEHPVQGPYAELHSCSIPNPVMMAGTLFLNKETIYFPQNVFPDMTTAFVANTTNYISLNKYYHYSYQKLGPDPEGIEMALDFMKVGRPAFMRLHLQEVGEASFQILFVKDNVPWWRNIWADGSPYVSMLARADAQLAGFLHGLDGLGILEKTALIIMGDHGEADTGYHPPESHDAAITSIVLWGAGVKKGIKIPYAEQIDVVPTICAILGVAAPRTSQGRIIGEALAHFSGKLPPRKMLFKSMIDQFEEFRIKEAESAFRLATLTSPEISRLQRDLGNIKMDFYGIEKFVEWPKFGQLESLLENNQRAISRLNNLLEEIRALK